MSAPNKALLIKTFQDLAEIYKRDKFRLLAYKRVLTVLKNFEGTGPHGDIIEDDLPRLNEMKGVGQKSKEKIKEILCTKELGKLEKLKSEITPEQAQKRKYFDLFEGILGVGAVTAKKWYDAGYRSLNDVMKHAKLSHEQELGIIYYTDLQERIPRLEMCLYEKVLKFLFEQLSEDWDVEFQIEMTGSYRKGLLSSGDIDLVVTDKSGKLLETTKTIKHQRELTKRYLTKIVQRLKDEKIIIDDLSIGDRKYRGLARLDNPAVQHFIRDRDLQILYTPRVRRLDIEFTIDPATWPFTLLYFSGSDVFERDLRAHAKSKGMKLDEKGLTVLKTGKSLHAKTEADIFRLLGLEYIPPEKR
jgi:DNA polymerase/3'-5' exonuclease PolX